MGRRVIFTERKIASRIHDGYGQGNGAGYKSWLKVGDFPSLGRCHRIRGAKINRIFHFFSDLEQYYFYLLEWQDNVEDIREQFPLFPVSETERIASSMEYKHPHNVGGHNSCVMTTDFLITTKIGEETQLFARSVKYAKEIENKRVLEKLSIEKEYWDRRGVPWQLVTNLVLNQIDEKNTLFLNERNEILDKSKVLSGHEIEDLIDTVVRRKFTKERGIHNGI